MYTAYCINIFKHKLKEFLIRREKVEKQIFVTNINKIPIDNANNDKSNHII
jgi:hypothetical protein